MDNDKGYIMIKVPVPNFKRVRFVSFVVLFFISVIILPITSSLTTQSQIDNAGSYGVGIATSSFTLLVTFLVLLVEGYCPPTWLSSTVFELTWMFLMIAFWGATGGIAANSIRYTCRGMCFRYWNRTQCSGFSYSICQQLQVITAFSWIAFIILSILFTWELVAAIRASKRGDGFIWTTAVHSYQSGVIRLDTSIPVFNASIESLAKGKAVDEERGEAPSPTAAI
ncbi:hypothetical protein CALCODRAFT_496461 [Calocera cornea HHB12733]|uniref:MARVEL domain-containing protein n=1 Tax=Calocera cornea HHB12733 TaxID=1353952 RepID=A0A165FSX9_9BASI|nr:hypothetical protein CALCODRAFT_496461 [Calocera cornea HHB12733]